MNFEFEYPNIHMSHVTQLVMIIIIFHVIILRLLKLLWMHFQFSIAQMYFSKWSPKIVPTKNLRFHNHTSDKEIDNLFTSMFSKFMFQNTFAYVPFTKFQKICWKCLWSSLNQFFLNQNQFHNKILNNCLQWNV
jgi:hypothetical protein